jgi:hypothetical protein
MSSRTVLSTSCEYLLALAVRFFNPVYGSIGRRGSDFLLVDVGAVADSYKVPLSSSADTVVGASVAFGHRLAFGSKGQHDAGPFQFMLLCGRSTS